MKARISVLVCAMLLAIGPTAFTQNAKKPSTIYARQNLVAWCIVPYDKLKRGPAERVSMLRELGITQLAYDWRDEHLPTMEEEIKTLKKNNIKLKSVWFWVDGGGSGTLGKANHYILKTLKENEVKTELWVSFSDGFFAGLTDDEKFQKAVSAVGEINKKAQDIGCNIHLYNHGGWFGEPQNQVRIIEALGTRDVGMVYNFHHARHQIDEFPQLIQLMKPYLSTVNINGMKELGPITLPVGQGDKEASMLQTLKDSGYNGSIGILGHVDDEDAKVVLQRNMSGLKTLLKKMGDQDALQTY